MKETLSEKASRAYEIIEELRAQLETETRVFFTKEEVEEQGEELWESPSVYLLNKHSLWSEYKVASIDKGNVQLVGVGDFIGESELVPMSNLNSDDILGLASCFD